MKQYTLAKDDLLEALKAVAEPTRLRVLVLCAQGEWSVSELVQVLGQSQPRVSRHLKLMCDADLLERYQEQNRVYYRLGNGALGAHLTPTLLNMLAADDEQLAIDRQRLQVVKQQRTAEASSTLAHVEAERKKRRELLPPQHKITKEVQNLLADFELGAVIDIGSGAGRILQILAARAERVVGIDISADMLQAARSVLTDVDFRHCELRKGNMYQLDYADQSFNTVALDEVLGGAEHPEMVLQESVRLLADKGLLLVIDVLQSELSQAVHLKFQSAYAEAECLGVNEQQLENYFSQLGIKMLASKKIAGKAFSTILALAQKS